MKKKQHFFFTNANVNMAVLSAIKLFFYTCHHEKLNNEKDTVS